MAAELTARNASMWTRDESVGEVMKGHEVPSLGKCFSERCIRKEIELKIAQATCYLYLGLSENVGSIPNEIAI